VCPALYVQTSSAPADDVIMSTGYNLCLEESANSTGILWKSFLGTDSRKIAPRYYVRKKARKILDPAVLPFIVYKILQPNLRT